MKWNSKIADFTLFWGGIGMMHWGFTSREEIFVFIGAFLWLMLGSRMAKEKEEKSIFGEMESPWKKAQ